MIKNSQKGLVRWIAVGVGVGVGFVRFSEGLKALITLNNRDGWAGLITVLAATLSLLPLTLVGIFRPRFAAYSLFASLAIGLIGYLLWTGGEFLDGIMGFLTLCGVFILPYTGVALLLLLGSDSAEPSPTA